MDQGMTVTAPSLAAYRTPHKIVPLPSPNGWQVCATDGIRVYRVVSTRWNHDQEAIRRLRRDETRRYVSEVDTDGLTAAKAADELAREDAFTNGRLTFDWHSLPVDLDLA